MMTIDPGASGGIAWMEHDSKTVKCMPMPEGMTGVADYIREIAIPNHISVCVVEAVGGYRPGNSGPAAVKFARHCGHIEAIMYMLGIRVEQVQPNKWMSAIGTWPKGLENKKERKNAIKEEMARRYPHLRVTLAVSDALGIMEYAIQKGKQ